MNPVMFGAGQIIVRPSYLRANDPEEIAAAMDVWAPSVPDDCVVSLIRGGAPAPIDPETIKAMQDDPTVRLDICGEDGLEGPNARDGVFVEGEDMGYRYMARREGQSTADLLGDAITTAIGDRTYRHLLRTDPQAAAEFMGQHFREVARSLERAVEADMNRTWFRRWIVTPLFNLIDRHHPDTKAGY